MSIYSTLHETVSIYSTLPETVSIYSTLPETVSIVIQSGEGVPVKAYVTLALSPESVSDVAKVWIVVPSATFSLTASLGEKTYECHESKNINYIHHNKR